MVTKRPPCPNKVWYSQREAGFGLPLLPFSPTSRPLLAQNKNTAMSTSLGPRDCHLNVTAPPHVIAPPSVIELVKEDEAEALEFLAVRPLHTVFMASLIRDNGIVSSFNRGSFFACRNSEGALSGMGLIGHATIFEAHDNESIEALACLATVHPLMNLVRGERWKVQLFWSIYSGGRLVPRLVTGELLLEQRTAPENCEAVPTLRLATADDLQQVMNVNASMAFQDGGVNPFDRDPEGFHERTSRRVDMGRIWVLLKEGQLVFKVDVISETPQVTYLEGVYVDPTQRGKGYGLRCLAQLARILLPRAGSLCLTVNEASHGPRSFYEKAGYKACSQYDTIYVQ